MKNKLIIAFLFFTTIFQMYGQKNYFEDAELAFNNEKYFSAINIYKKAEAREKKIERKRK